MLKIWATGWFPSEIELSIDGIRELRNLVHPGRLVKDRGGRTLTQQELDALHDTCVNIHVSLMKKISELYPSDPENIDAEGTVL